LRGNPSSASLLRFALTMLSSLSIVALLVAVAAVWRVTHALVHEAGPFDGLTALRGVALFRGVLGCFYCTSLWAALPIALWLGQGLVEVVVLCVGFSGGAILIERLSGGPMPAPALWQEDPQPQSNAEQAVSAAVLRVDPPPKESNDVLLRP